MFLICVLLLFFLLIISVGRVRRHQRGNQNPYIEEEQTTQWPKEQGQKDKQRFTKNTQKTKYVATPTPLKIGDELRCSEGEAAPASLVILVVLI